ncbi:MAG: hypothetical protein B6D34_13600 [Candidatus Brocadia sp. UTAMX1]|nr:MAG: hypothetical protein B6D34_13600 [Candidatus Brocadia sp. UTAMX1]
MMQKNTIHYTSLISEYAFITYFFILSFFPFSRIKLLCLLTVVGCWIARMLQEKKMLFAKTTLTVPILSFLVCSLISSFHSAHVMNSLGTVMHDYCVYFTIFFCMVNTIDSQEQIRRIVKALLVTCGLVCLYGLYGYYTGIAIRDGRFIATFEYHSRIAKYISLFLPVALCLFFSYKNRAIRFSLACLIFVGGFSLILTMSRTSWVSIFIAIFFASFALQKKRLILILIGICMLLIFFLPAKFINQAKTITQVNQFFTSEKILGERLLCWKAAIAIIHDHPWLGIGSGKKNFRFIYQQYAETIRDREKHLEKEPVRKQDQEKKSRKKIQVENIERLSHPHNIFLHIWVGNGIVGLLSFLWMFTMVFYTAIQSWRLSKAGYEKALLLGIVAGLVSIFLHGLTDSFWKKPDALFLWYIIGILFVVIHLISGNSQNELLLKGENKS